MDISIKRDGPTLNGRLEKPDICKCPIAIMFHGFTGNLGYSQGGVVGGMLVGYL